ncbi:hypothetical protein F4802DRAFT_57288 [Xylaria palmicola]|nr:hypothetical protein F4802DRAFT_57288 [Xylaria palmicola]
MDALTVASNVIQIVELGRRLIEYLIDSARRFDQEDVFSLKTDTDEVTAKLQLLRSMASGSDVESTVFQCLEKCESVSRVLAILVMVNSSKKEHFVGYICGEMAPLRVQLPALALKSIRQWHDLEARGLLHPVLTAYLNSYFAAYRQGDSIGSFPPTSGPRRPRGPMLLHLLTSSIPPSNRERYELNLKNDILAEIYNGTAQLSPPIRPLNASFEKDLQQRFLGSLRYQGMDDWRSATRDAHGTSFSWIFENFDDIRGHNTGFRDWLSNSDSSALYWIQGKAGAGKTTLMKYILSSVEGFSSLHAYSPNSTDYQQIEDICKCFWKANVASFFFNNAGSPIQRTSAGFLRSVLFQVLSQNPGIIPAVAPSRWEALLLFGEDPKPLDVLELRKMLVSTLGERRAKVKTFLFIDGLDESEQSDGHFQIIELLHEIAAYPGVKICISSRPLPQFRDMIDSASSLTLENCTWGDIGNFVGSEIEAQLLITPEASLGLSSKEKLVHELTTKASGCFLWAALVVKSLQADLANGRGDIDLLRFVNDVPTELNALLRSFLVDLDTSQPFLTSAISFIGLSPEPLLFRRLSSMEKNFTNSVLYQDGPYLLREQRQSSERTLFNSKGLLKVNWSRLRSIREGERNRGLDACVSLVHRSVREFLEADIALNAACSSHEGRYDSAARYCAASLSFLQTSSIGGFTPSSISSEATRCAYMAMLTRTENEKGVIRILDELDWTCHTLLQAATPPTPWISADQTATLNSRSPISWIFYDSSVARYDRISENLRRRVTNLYLRYGFAGMRETPMIPDQWHDCCCKCGHNSYSALQINGSGRGCVLASTAAERQNLVSFRRHNVILTENTSLGAMGSHQGAGLQTMDSEMPKQPSHLRDVRSGLDDVLDFTFQPPHSGADVTGPHSTRDALLEEEPEPNDDGDNMSWESFSSSGLSLDEAHPLMAFRDEVTQALLQGFMVYRQRHASGDLEGLRASEEFASY